MHDLISATNQCDHYRLSLAGASKNSAEAKYARLEWMSTGGFGDPPAAKEQTGECAQQTAEALVEGAKLPCTPATSSGNILGKLFK